MICKVIDFFAFIITPALRVQHIVTTWNELITRLHEKLDRWQTRNSAIRVSGQRPLHFFGTRTLR